MAMYRKKTLVDAKVYEPGMEDGFIANLFDYNCYTMEQLEEKGIDFEEIKVPYINTIFGKMEVNEGDYILTNSEGGRVTNNPAYFEANYELMEE